MELTPLKRKTKAINALDILIIFLVLYLAVINIYRGYVVIGESMEPTYYQDDVILVNHLPFDYQKGDVVILQKEGYQELYIKRIVAVENEKLKFERKRNNISGLYEIKLLFYKDGQWEEYEDDFSMYSKSSFGPFAVLNQEYTVPKDCYFVLGDNRDISKDSRAFGFVSRREIKGKVINLITDNVFLRRIFAHN